MGWLEGLLAALAVTASGAIWLAIRSVRATQREKTLRETEKLHNRKRRKADEILAEPVADEDEWIARMRRRNERLRDR